MMNQQNKFPPVFLLGLSDTGYGTVRSLVTCQIPIIAFEKDLTRPEVKTRYCEKIVHYEDDKDLLSKIKTNSNELSQRPILYMSGDGQVDFVNRHRTALLELVDIDFPDSNTLETLLEKTRFTDFALEHNFKIPRTIVVDGNESIHQCLQDIQFPCVLKPSWRGSAWKAEKFPKVFVFYHPSSLSKWFERIRKIEPELIVQEWIPGADSNIYFCLTYYDHKSTCLAHFTGRKLRQWPIRTGSTACAEPIHEPTVSAETIRLFDEVNYRGFGSVEFKKHEETGEFFIMEPTVGRCNHQSYIATANGVNIPCIAYRSLTGIPLELPEPVTKPVTWIDDQFDGLSIIVNLFSGNLNFRHLFGSYLARKSFRFLSWDDRGPFVHVLLQAPRKLLKYIRKIVSF